MLRRVSSFLLLLSAFCLIICSTSEAQQQTPGWTFSTAAGYSNVTNAPTNNGFANVTELKLSEYLAVRGDVFVMISPAVIGSYVGPEYIFPASKLFKTNPANPVNAGNVEFFVNVKAGDLRSTDSSTTCVPGSVPNAASLTCATSQSVKAKFSWGVGGGFNIRLSEKTFIRPLDISYLRGSVFQGGGTVVGNHLELGAFVGVRF